MVEQFRNVHPRMFITNADIGILKKRLDDKRVQIYYKPAGVLERTAPAYNAQSRNGGRYRELGSYAMSFLLAPDERKLDPILDWLETATTYPHCGTDLDAEYFMEGLALTYD
jgi:hypothetical protein